MLLFSRQVMSNFCDSMDSTPGFPVPHLLPEFAQLHVCYMGDDGKPQQYTCHENPMSCVKRQMKYKISVLLCYLWSNFQYTKMWEVTDFIRWEIGWFCIVYSEGIYLEKTIKGKSVFGGKTCCPFFWGMDLNYHMTKLHKKTIYIAFICHESIMAIMRGKNNL